MINFRCINVAAVMGMCFLLAGCAAPEATIVYRPGYFVEKPDVIIVRPFAVTAQDAQKDADLLPDWIRTGRAEPQTPQDIEAGRAAALVVAQKVVDTLKSRNLPAVLASQGQPATDKTATIVGQFVNQATATGSLRPSIGFRSGQIIEARVQLVQHRQVIGEIKTYGPDKNLSSDSVSIARQIADVIEQGYLKNGWIPAPVKR